MLQRTAIIARESCSAGYCDRQDGKSLGFIKQGVKGGFCEKNAKVLILGGNFLMIRVGLNVMYSASCVASCIASYI